MPWADPKNCPRREAGRTLASKSTRQKTATKENIIYKTNWRKKLTVGQLLNPQDKKKAQKRILYVQDKLETHA